MRAVTVIFMTAALAVSALAQDWYHDREERFKGEAWKPKVFVHIKTDLEHIWSVNQASDTERKRIERTKEELTKMQADLQQGRWDNGLVNDVIDSLRKSANDDRLAARDRAVLADDVNRVKDYQDHHNQWPK
jgi:hypothetical protein